MHDRVVHCRCVTDVRSLGEEWDLDGACPSCGERIGFPSVTSHEQLLRVGPAKMYRTGSAVDGQIELTSDWIGFRPSNSKLVEQTAFLRWLDFRDVRVTRPNILHGAGVKVVPRSGVSPIFLLVSDPDAWVKEITWAYKMSVDKVSKASTQ